MSILLGIGLKTCYVILVLVIPHIFVWGSCFLLCTPLCSSPPAALSHTHNSLAQLCHIRVFHTYNCVMHNSFTHTTLRTTLSHKILFHTFTHNFVGHNSVTQLCQHNSVTHNSFTQNSVTQLSHCFFSVSGMAPGKESIYMLKHSHWQEHFNRTKTSGTTHTTNLITCKQVCIQSMMLSMLSHHLVFPDIGFHKVPRC